MSHLDGNLYFLAFCRVLQNALETAPTLFCGLVFAGIVRGMIRAETLRGWFTSDPRIGPVRACLIGLLLPVCSFGVLPLAWELRRAGVARATVLTFLLSAPLANPISLAYAYQKLESHGALPVGVFLGVLLGALVVLAGMGVLLGRWLPEPPVAPEGIANLPDVPASELRRLVVVGLTAARGLTGVLPLFLIVGFLGSGLLVCYPGGAFEQAANDRSVRAPLHMALVSFQAQVPPVQGSMLLCEMLFMSVSFGVAFIFLLLGVGMNLGTVVWIAWVYGFRIMLCVVPFVVGAALAVGYAVPLTLPNLPPDAAQGRHFLEIEPRTEAEVAWTRVVKDTLLDDRGQPQWLGLTPCLALGALALLGLASRVIGERASVRYLMSRAPAPSPLDTPPDSPGTVWNKQLSAQQLTVAGLALVLIVVGVVLYVTYPSPAALLDEMSNIQIELNLTLKNKQLDRPAALRLVAQWQRLQNKLALGDFLRRGRFDPQLRQANDELRMGIERLRTGLVDNKPPEELNELYGEARKAALKCRQTMEPGREP